MRRAAFAAALLLWAALPARAGKPFPPSPSSYVYNEGVLSSNGERMLSNYLSEFERQTGHQMVAAVFQSLDGESLEDYSNRLFRAWKIGDARRNDGLLVAVFKNDRRWRVEVGYGLEAVVTDLEAAEIARDYGVPKFREGDFDDGVYDVARALGEKVSGKTPSHARHRPPQSRPLWQDQLVFGLFLLAFWVLPLVLRLNGISTGYSSSWGGGGGGGGGGFSGGGGSSGGGGASGGW